MAEATSGRGPARSRVVRWTVGVAATAFLVSIGTPLIGVRVFHGADMLLDRPPWQVTPPTNTVASNPIVGDTVSTFMPLHAEVRRRLFGGDLPVWTALPGGGHPLASVPDAGAFGPLNLPYLVLPLSYAPGLAKLAELAVAMAFTFLFLRRIGLGPAPALFGGLVFSFSGFQVVWTNWPQSHVGALIPALFWAVERAVQERRAVDAIPVALAAAAMLLEGFPSVAGYATLAVGGYAVVRVATRRGVEARAWALGVVVGGLLLGVGMAAFQLLPLADRATHLDLSYRIQPPDWHLPPTALATVAIPDAFGSPADGTYWGPLNYVEIQSFIGASTLVLVVCAAAWRPPGGLARGATSFLWAGVVVAALLLFVGAPFLTLAQATDLFELNFVGRLRAVLGFFLAVLAALGLDVALRAPPATGRGRLRLIAAVGIAGAIAAVGMWRLGLAADVADRGGQLAAASAVPLAAAGLAGLFVVLSRRGRWRRLQLAAWLLPAIFAVEALAFAIPFWPRIDPDAFYPTTVAHRQVARRLGAGRLLGAGGAMFPGTTTFYGLRSLTTNNTLPQPATWEDLIRAVDPGAFEQSPVFPSLSPTHEVATSPVLDRMAVRYVVVPPTVSAFGERVRTGGGTSPPESLEPGRMIAATPDGVGPWRAVLLPLTAPLNVPPDARLVAEIRDAGGATIARGEQLVFDGQGPGTVQVLLPEAPCEPLCAPPFSVEVSLDAPTGRAMVASGEDGEPALSMVEAVDDGLRLEVVANVAGYRRLEALPRIRWAARSRVVTDPAERIATLGDDLPPDIVLLGRSGPAGEGRAATIDVVRDTGDEVRVNVAAAGDGYLVVADPIQHGWEATVDGRPVPLRSADHALVAVFVSEGRHQVDLRFASTSWRAGILLTLGSVGAIAVIGAAWALQRRRHRRSTPR